MRKLYLTFWIGLLMLSPALSRAQGKVAPMLEEARREYQAGNHQKANEIYKTALTQAEAAGDDHLKAEVMRLMGENFRSMGELALALEKLRTAEQMSRSQKDSVLIGKVLNRIAAVYYEMRDVDDAFDYASQSLAIMTALHDTSFISNNLNILGAVARTRKEFDDAIRLFNQAAMLMQGTEDSVDVANVYNNISNTYLTLNKPEEALKYAHMGLDIAMKAKVKVYIFYSYQNIIEALVMLEKFGDAFHILVEKDKYKDSLFNESKTAAIRAALQDSDNEKLRLENETEREKARRQGLVLIGVAVIAAIATVFFVIQFRAHRKLAQAHELLKAKNDEIGEKNRAISESERRLSESNQAKDRLLSIVAHDVRSPLNSIQGILTLVKNGSLSAEEMNQITGTLIERVEHTNTLLENLLSWAHSQLDGFQTRPTTIQLRNLAAKVIGQLSGQIEKKKLVIENLIAADQTALADGDMIEIVVRNLLANAVKFTPAGGYIKLAVHPAGRQVTFQIEDTGHGMRPEVLQKVLSGESYSTPGTAQEKGSGLGLILCRDFVMKNGGTFTATSSPGKGSTFSFTLPAEPTES